MKNNDDRKFAGEAVNEASTWFIRLLDEDLSEENYLEWQEWLAKNEANKKAFARAEDFWRDLYNDTNLPLTQKKTATSGNHTTSLLSRCAPIAATILIILAIGLFILTVRTLL